MVCLGTRPEAIKLAPVIGALRDRDDLSVTTVSTGQHRELLDQMLGFFGIEPDVDLGLMTHDQSLSTLTAAAIDRLGSVMAAAPPSVVLVQGDTTTALCAALAAFYAGVPVGHVEAGLRTHDRRRPFPEEVNRRMVAIVTHWHFCATQRSADNLAREGVSKQTILVTGNTVIDALLQTAARPLEARMLASLPRRRAARRVLVTLHRRETQGHDQRRLCRVLREIARRDDIEIVFPVHMSPAVRASVLPELEGLANVRLIDPLPYPAFVHVLSGSDIVVTDSGGVQEEAPSFGIPVLVVRDTTERPEGVEAGCARLCGTNPVDMRLELERLLDDGAAYAAMAHRANPYGDGAAADRIARRLARDLAGTPPTIRARPTDEELLVAGEAVA
jgi:UDP-N-acetylglucosamine 2-epimerase (non-hydrolysing)